MDLNASFTRIRTQRFLESRFNSYYRFAEFEVHHGKGGEEWDSYVRIGCVCNRYILILEKREIGQLQ